MLKIQLVPLFLIIISINVSANQVYLTLVREYSLGSEGRDILVNEGVAYVISGGTLTAFNTTEPFDQYAESYLGALNGTQSMAFSGRIAYSIGPGSGISLFDFTKDPPALRNSILTNGTITKLVIDYGYMYVLNQSAGLQVYDVNIADFPILKNTQIIPGGEANGIFVKDRKAYITTTNANLSIIDVNDIAKLPIVGSYTNGVKFYEPFVDGNYAYVPQGNTGVQVINITKLPFPEWVTNLYSRKSAKQVVASNFYIWVADDKSIEGFFNKDAKTFYFAGNYKNDKTINRIALIEGKYIFVATSDKKLKILRIDYQY
ncbi:MAG: hypothetical protein IT281_05590 [Ignavibacteria bacterium]|nr:hypothetical protein [Ignavibacteria bacterium]MCC7158991.1 hypothetical protein [Ignavibacteria bacterium]